MFDLDQFIADCVDARAETNAVVAVKEVLERAFADPSAIAKALPATMAEFGPIYTSSDISIFKFVWGPSMVIPPHDHLMWATIGIYGGGEDNVFYRRTPTGLVPSGGKEVRAGETTMLGADVIHAVTNPSSRTCTGSIHIYGGDYMHQSRSVWDAETFEERPADGETIRRMFEEERARAAEQA